MQKSFVVFKMPPALSTVLVGCHQPKPGLLQELKWNSCGSL